MMQLYAEEPYWLMKDGIVSSYSSLDKDVSVDVAIIGAGISGALMAYDLRNDGHEVAVFERRHVGTGSTAASTSFLQYEIDVPLRQLSNYVGSKNAVASYQLCREAIGKLQHISKTLHQPVGFRERPSLQFASFKKHKDDLYEEYILRKRYRFDVQWLNEQDLKNKFKIEAPSAMLSADGGEVDAYMLTHALLAVVAKKGHHIYTNTDIKEVVHHKRHVELMTANNTIKAKKLVIACGYESQKYLPDKLSDVHTTYAFVSEPIENLDLSDCLVWETAEPYTYFRKVDDCRVLVGGKDDPHHHASVLPSVIKKKAHLLAAAFHRRVPDIALKVDFSWAGAFVTTKDGLPFIGTVRQRPNTYFALGYGGNGITFSVIAAEIIRDMLNGKQNNHSQLFGFGR